MASFAPTLRSLIPEGWHFSHLAAIPHGDWQVCITNGIWLVHATGPTPEEALATADAKVRRGDINRRRVLASYREALEPAPVVDLRYLFQPNELLKRI